MTYDSTKDTMEHIERVQTLMGLAVDNLVERGIRHDQSKLQEPEKSGFDNAPPLLQDVVYGSDAYHAGLAQLGEALAHHYAHNSHHPEHYADGIRGMSLLDLLEMLLDWKAASERYAAGDVFHSLEINQERFGYTDELQAILLNTAREMGWTREVKA